MPMNVKSLRCAIKARIKWPPNKSPEASPATIAIIGIYFLYLADDAAG